MASVDQPFQPADSENQNNQTTANSSVSQPQVSGGTGSIGGGAGSGAAPKGQLSGATPEATNSGAYPNLQKYMQANQGWNSSQGGLGGEVASNLNQQGNQVQQSVQNAQQAFQNQGNNWQSNVDQSNQAFQQGLTNPIGYLQNNPNAQQQANTALNAQYTGAQNLNTSNPGLGQQVQNYANTAQQGQTEAGRYNLLQQMFGNAGNYNQGQQSLDQALIENSPGQIQALQGAQQQANQTNLGYQNANQAATAQAQAWQNYANTAQQQARGAYNTAVTNEGQNIQNEYQTALTQQQQDLANLGQAFNTGNITQAQANEIGLTPGSQLLGQNIYNVNLGQFLTPALLNAQNTATAGDYAKIGALSQLGQLAPGAISSPASQVLAQYQNQPGTLYNSTNDVGGINTAAAEQAINQAQQAYQSAISPVQQQLNWLNSAYQSSPYTFQGAGGNGYLGALNTAANALQTSGFANNLPGAANMTNEQLVQAAEQAGQSGNLNASTQTALTNALGGLAGFVDFSPVNGQVNLGNGTVVTGNPYTIGDIRNMESATGAPITDLTQLVSAYQNQIGAKQAALRQLANQYDANKVLQIAPSNS